MQGKCFPRSYLKNSNWIVTRIPQIILLRGMIIANARE